MTIEYSAKDASLIAASFQDHILPGVSRTFALTIPQLPQPLALTTTASAPASSPAQSASMLARAVASPASCACR